MTDELADTTPLPDLPTIEDAPTIAPEPEPDAHDDGDQSPLVPDDL